MSQVSLDSSPQSSDSIRLFDDFLQALCDPEGGGRLCQMHAPGAAILPKRKCSLMPCRGRTFSHSWQARSYPFARMAGCN